MDVETRRQVGWAIIAAVVLALGVLGLLVDATATKLLGGLAVWVGGVVLAVAVVRLALRLIRA